MEPTAVLLVKTALGPVDSGTVAERITHAREELTSAGEILDLVEELVGGTTDEDATAMAGRVRPNSPPTPAKPSDKPLTPKPTR